MDSHGFDQYFEHEERIVAQREKDLAAHKERLAQQAARLTEVLSALGARRVWVFGSFARGHVRSDSDLDMAVEGLPYSQDQLLGVAEQSLGGGLALDLVPWEAAGALLRERILSEGRILYEREE
jgi:hypothetical protein